MEPHFLSSATVTGFLGSSANPPGHFVYSLDHSHGSLSHCPVAAAATLSLCLGWVHWAFQEAAQTASTPHLITPSSCILLYFVMQLKLGQRMYSKISDMCFKTSYTIGASGNQGYRVSPKPWSLRPARVKTCTCFFYLSILLKQIYRIAKGHLKMRAVG